MNKQEALELILTQVRRMEMADGQAPPTKENRLHTVYALRKAAAGVASTRVGDALKIPPHVLVEVAAYCVHLLRDEVLEEPDVADQTFEEMIGAPVGPLRGSGADRS